MLQSGFVENDGESIYYETAGTGHSPYFETPEAWKETVLNFLKSAQSTPNRK